MENKEWAFSNGRLIEKESEIKNIINSASAKRQLDEAGLLKVFNQILRLI